MIKKLSIALVVASMALTACGKKEPIKTEAEIKADNAKMVRDNPVYGEQMKALDKAKAVGDEANKVAEDKLKKADQ